MRLFNILTRSKPRSSKLNHDNPGCYEWRGLFNGGLEQGVQKSVCSLRSYLATGGLTVWLQMPHFNGTVEQGMETSGGLYCSFGRLIGFW